MPWSIETDVAPVTFHTSFDEDPWPTVLGSPVKVRIAGAPGAGLTTAVAKDVAEPYTLVAVSV